MSTIRFSSDGKIHLKQPHSTHCPDNRNLSTRTLRWPLKPRRPLDLEAGDRATNTHFPLSPPKVPRLPCLTVHHLQKGWPAHSVPEPPAQHVRPPGADSLGKVLQKRVSSSSTCPESEMACVTFPGTVRDVSQLPKKHPTKQSLGWNHLSLDTGRNTERWRVGVHMTVTTAEHRVQRPQGLTPSAWGPCLLSANPTPGQLATLHGPWPHRPIGQCGEWRDGAQACWVMTQNPWCCLSSNLLTFANSTTQALCHASSEWQSLTLVSASRHLIKVDRLPAPWVLPALITSWKEAIYLCLKPTAGHGGAEAILCDLETLWDNAPRGHSGDHGGRGAQCTVAWVSSAARTPALALWTGQAAPEPGYTAGVWTEQTSSLVLRHCILGVFSCTELEDGNRPSFFKIWAYPYANIHI